MKHAATAEAAIAPAGTAAIASSSFSRATANNENQRSQEDRLNSVMDPESQIQKTSIDYESSHACWISDSSKEQERLLMEAFGSVPLPQKKWAEKRDQSSKNQTVKMRKPSRDEGFRTVELINGADEGTRTLEYRDHNPGP